MDNDFLNIKTILAYIATPFTLLIGWHYKNFYGRINSLEIDSNKTQVSVGKHKIRLDYLDDSVSKLENKIDNILDIIDNKVDSIISKLEKL